MAKLVAITTTVTTAAVAVLCAPSHAADEPPTVTVTDQHGAPREMLQQLERVIGQPLGTLDRVLAVDTAGETLTGDQLETLIAGGEVEGAKVLGVMRGSEELLGTTMADLSDGTHDERPRVGEPSTSTLIVVTDAPPWRDWCSTVCIPARDNKSVWECIFWVPGRRF